MPRHSLLVPEGDSDRHDALLSQGHDLSVEATGDPIDVIPGANPVERLSLRSGGDPAKIGPLIAPNRSIESMVRTLPSLSSRRGREMASLTNRRCQHVASPHLAVSRVTATDW